ncbi:MAG: hypothetical protein HY916_03230 [Desulfovibrio sp.]|jgi:hypothetical protein|nr:hypothetical protein [Desulfovibrio sp.]
MNGGAHGRKASPAGGRTLFTLEIEGTGVRARKKAAPPARPHADKRRKEPRRRRDYFAEITE